MSSGSMVNKNLGKFKTIGNMLVCIGATVRQATTSTVQNNQVNSKLTEATITLYITESLTELQYQHGSWR
jgi:hypothetical protein